VFTGLDPWEGMAQRPMSLNGYSWVEGRVSNLIDSTGMQGETPEDFADCVESHISGIGHIRSCQVLCDRNYPGALQGLQRAACRAGCRGNYQLRNRRRDEAIDAIRAVENNVFPIESQRGVDDFVRLSNTVANIVENELSDYLYVMNGLLLGYRSSGDLSVIVTAAVAQDLEDQIKIGWNGLHCDYDDRTTG